LKVLLADTSIRLSFAAALRREAGEGAAFALDGGTPGEALPPESYGATRNLALLLAAGSRFAFCDDDVLPDFRIPSSFSEEAFESDEKDPTLIYPYRKSEGLESFSLSVEGLPIDAYPYLLRGSDDAFPRRPAAICFGTWGDGGMPSSRYLLMNRGQVASELFFDEEAYEEAMNGRSLLRATDARISGGLFFIGMHAILDASALLPPFSPLGRGEDTLWGASVAALHPELAICHTPYCVHHDPLPRASSGKAGALGWGMSLDSILLFLVAKRRTDGGPEAYRTIGKEILELSSRSAEGLRELLYGIALAAAESRLATYKQALDAWDSSPSWWARDVEGAMAAVRSDIEAYTPKAPHELADLDAFAAYLSGFGRMLQAWPETFAAARRLGPEFLEAARL
jgi:hypothetical protein